MQVCPPALIKAVKHSLINNSVHIFEGTAANKLLFESDKVVGVKTNHNEIFAEQVVVCNGAWAQQFLNQISHHLTDIEPVRGQMLMFKTKQQLFSNIVVNDGYYLIPRKDQYALCGSTVEYVGYNKETTSEAYEMLKTQACDMCPALLDEQVVQHWSGLRPGTARELPYVCAHPNFRGLYINAGHFRYGIVTSIPTARMASELVLKKDTASQISVCAC